MGRDELAGRVWLQISAKTAGQPVRWRPRPLLDWRSLELAGLIAAAGLSP